MRNTCVTCKKNYELDQTNSIIYLYKDRTYMDNVQMVCENGHCEILFFYEPDARDQFLRDHDHLTIVREDHPDLAVIEAYEVTFDITLIETVELTPRHLKLLAELAEILARTPDEFLLEIFTHPPPKSRMPRKWC